MFTLAETETACGVTMEDVEAFALTSAVTDGMAVIDQFASPAQAGATARYLAGRTRRIRASGGGQVPDLSPGVTRMHGAYLT